MDAASAPPVPECPSCRAWLAERAALEARILLLEGKLRDLEDKLKPPPSPRPLEPVPPAPVKQPTGKKRGAQPGHPPHLKKFLPRERVTETHNYVPAQCAKCDKALSVAAGPNDPEPTRHQVVELPDIRAQVIEHLGHFRTCTCGHVNHEVIPADIRAHSVGPKLTAAMSYLVGAHGLGKRGTEETAEAFFEVPIALGTIANLEQEMATALEPAYQEARQSVASASVKYVDETGWKEAGKKRWLWVAATLQCVLFLIHPRRNLDALKMLLGGRLTGTLVSDRWRVYDHWDEEKRQLCWAHVERNWEKKIERGGEAKALGERWLAGQKEVFELWHRFKNPRVPWRPLTREELEEAVLPWIEALGEVLGDGVDSGNASLSRYCQRLLDKYHMYWLFSWEEGVEPTNNHAERVQRRAVIWRKRSFGCQSEKGCRFVERILTVVGSLRLQGRSTLGFLTQSLTALRTKSAPPKLVTG